MGVTKYHISTNGQVATCRAEIKCRLTDISGEGKAKHFETKQDAQAYAEKAMSEKHNVTKSAGKSSSAKQTPLERKGSFSIPSTMKTLLGNNAYTLTGGNYSRLKDAGLNPTNKSVVVSEMREDIKNALKVGALPKEINGKKIAYKVIAGKAVGGVSTVDIKGYLDESRLDYEPVFKPMTIGDDPRLGTFEMQSRSQEELDKVSQTLDDLHQSYVHSQHREGYNVSNYSLRGDGAVYNHINDIDEKRKAEKKAVKQVAESLVDYVSQQSKENDKEYYSHKEMTDLVDDAVAKDPKLKALVDDWASKTNESSMGNNLKQLSAQSTFNFNKKVREENLSEADAEFERESTKGVLIRTGIASRQRHAELKESNAKASKLSSMEFFTTAEDKKRGKDEKKVQVNKFVSKVTESLERRSLINGYRL